MVVTPAGEAESSAGAPAPPTNAPWPRPWRWTSLVALGLVLVLAVTGVVLHNTYRPTAPQSWESVTGLAEGDVPGEQIARRLHRAASQLLVVVAMAVAVTGIGAAFTRRRGFAPGGTDDHRARRGPRRWVIAALAAGAVPVLASVASVTGYLLPWDNIAFWAVDLDTEARGMAVAMTDQVRFVLFGGGEVSPQTLRRSYIVHIVVAVVLAVALLPGLLAWRRRRVRPT